MQSHDTPHAAALQDRFWSRAHGRWGNRPCSLGFVPAPSRLSLVHCSIPKTPMGGCLSNALRKLPKD